MLYTSGSTGRPKGVMLTHRTVCNNAWAIGSYLRNEPDDVVLCVLPLSFSYGLFQVLTAVEVGYAVVARALARYPAGHPPADERPRRDGPSGRAERRSRSCSST